MFLNKAYEYDKDRMPDELAQDSTIRKAIEKLDVMSLDKEEREIYENDLKRLRIYKADIKTAERKGEKRKAIEIAKNLIDVLDMETISLKTGLSIEETKSLADK